MFVNQAINIAIQVKKLLLAALNERKHFIEFECTNFFAATFNTISWT